MADMMKAESFASVYVLDAHFQYKDAGVVNIFNSPAGRAVVNRTVSPEKNHKTHNQKTFCSNRLPNNDSAKFVLNPETLISDDLKTRNFTIFPPPIDYAALQSNQRADRSDNPVTPTGPDCDPCATSAECITRRSVTSRSVHDLSVQRGKVLQCETTKSPEKKQTFEDVRIDGRRPDKNLMKKRRFSEEKCDILRRLVSSFLSGWTAGSVADMTRWRKRKSSEELYREASLALGIPCELTDSCRCLECQCHYFDCGDTDSDTSEMSINLYDCDVEEMSCDRSSSTNHNSDVFYYEDETSYGCPERQTSIDVPSDAEAEGGKGEDSTQLYVGSDEGFQGEGRKDWRRGGKSDVSAAAILKDGGDLAPTIEIAAGTPVILDHLLNNPMACNLQ